MHLFDQNPVESNWASTFNILRSTCVFFLIFSFHSYNLEGVLKQYYLLLLMQPRGIQHQQTSPNFCVPKKAGGSWFMHTSWHFLIILVNFGYLFFNFPRGIHVSTGLKAPETHVLPASPPRPPSGAALPSSVVTPHRWDPRNCVDPAVRQVSSKVGTVLGGSSQVS